MQRFLKPVGLRYEVEDRAVVLFRRVNPMQSDEPTPVGPNVGTTINCSVPKKSVQYIAIDLAAKRASDTTGERSYTPDRHGVQEVRLQCFDHKPPFAKAMASILDPVVCARG